MNDLTLQTNIRCFEIFYFGSSVLYREFFETLIMGDFVHCSETDKLRQYNYHGVPSGHLSGEC